MIPLDQQGVEARLGGPISVAHDRDGVLQSQHVADTLKPSGCPIVQAGDPAAIDRDIVTEAIFIPGTTTSIPKTACPFTFCSVLKAFDRPADDLHWPAPRSGTLAGVGPAAASPASSP